MSKMIQIRNVPDAVHRKIKARAAEEGMSISDWLLREVGLRLEQPSRAEILARVAGREAVEAKPAAAQILREERDKR